MGDVHLDVDDHVAVITVDSPEVKNGLTPEMGARMVEICEEIDVDESIGAAVVRGANGTFCSGADTRTWTANRDPAEDQTYKRSGQVYQAFARVGELRCASIAAVRGAAVGAGMNLALACDLRVVADDARLLSGFVRIGIHPGGGYFTISGRTAGREATAAMGLFSQEVDGRRAVEIGLAWESLPDDQVEDRALELARTAAKDPELMRQVVRSFRTELGPPPIPWAAALEFERATQMWTQRRREASS